jgi:hypothetical protein
MFAMVLGAWTLVGIALTETSDDVGTRYAFVARPR